MGFCFEDKVALSSLIFFGGVNIPSLPQS